MTTKDERLSVKALPRSVYIRGFRHYPYSFCIYEDEAHELIEKLSDGFGYYVHLPDGCEDDGCPCRQRKESQR